MVKRTTYNARDLAAALNNSVIRFPTTMINQKAIEKKRGENCYFVCYEWKCEPNPGGTVHCECVRGEVICE